MSDPDDNQNLVEDEDEDGEDEKRGQPKTSQEEANQREDVGVKEQILADGATGAEEGKLAAKNKQDATFASGKKKRKKDSPQTTSSEEDDDHQRSSRPSAKKPPPVASRPTRKRKSEGKELSLFERDKRDRKRRLNRITAQRKRLRQRTEAQHLREAQDKLIIANKGLKVENAALRDTIGKIRRQQEVRSQPNGEQQALLMNPIILHSQHALMRAMSQRTGEPPPPPIAAFNPHASTGVAPMPPMQQQPGNIPPSLLPTAGVAVNNAAGMIPSAGGFALPPNNMAAFATMIMGAAAAAASGAIPQMQYPGQSQQPGVQQPVPPNPQPAPLQGMQAQSLTSTTNLQQRTVNARQVQSPHPAHLPTQHPPTEAPQQTGTTSRQIAQTVCQPQVQSTQSIQPSNQVQHQQSQSVQPAFLASAQQQQQRFSCLPQADLLASFPESARPAMAATLCIIQLAAVQSMMMASSTTAQQQQQPMYMAPVIQMLAPMMGLPQPNTNPLIAAVVVAAGLSAMIDQAARTFAQSQTQPVAQQPVPPQAQPGLTATTANLSPQVQDQPQQHKNPPLPHPQPETQSQVQEEQPQRDQPQPQPPLQQTNSQQQSQQQQSDQQEGAVPLHPQQQSQQLQQQQQQQQQQTHSQTQTQESQQRQPELQVHQPPVQQVMVQVQQNQQPELQAPNLVPPSQSQVNQLEGQQNPIPAMFASFLAANTPTAVTPGVPNSGQAGPQQVGVQPQQPQPPPLPMNAHPSLTMNAQQNPLVAGLRVAQLAARQLTSTQAPPPKEPSPPGSNPPN